MIAGVLAGQMIAASGGGGGSLPTTIGEAFGGGYYIGDIVVGADTYAIIMAELSGEGDYAWKGSATDTPGTDSAVDGAANTAAMLSATGHPAATHCDNYVVGIYDDWYMPAKDELNLAWTNIASLDALSMGWRYFWSSTQTSAAGAYRQYYRYGNQQIYNKAYGNKVRPVRRLLK